jgi:DNA-binding transcriptional MerR regulator
MISINEASDILSISLKKMRYYMYTKEINYEIKDNKFYLSDEEFNKLKKIVLLRRLGLSFEDIDDIKKHDNMSKYLLKLDKMIPNGNKYEAIKIIVNIMLKDKVSFITLNRDKYLDLVNKYSFEGKKFYSFNEDITYEDYKSSKFNVEYIVMSSVVTLLFLILTLTQGIDLFISLFPYFFIGLFLTLVLFFIPIKVKYQKKINSLLRRNYHEKD